MEFLAWTVIGAIIGYLAANRRGWSVTAGILGGAFLGLLAPLLFFVSGVSRNERKCPHCAEQIRKEANVCKHCGREVSAA